MRCSKRVALCSHSLIRPHWGAGRVGSVAVGSGIETLAPFACSACKRTGLGSADFLIVMVEPIPVEIVGGGATVSTVVRVSSDESTDATSAHNDDVERWRPSA